MNLHDHIWKRFTTALNFFKHNCVNKHAIGHVFTYYALLAKNMQKVSIFMHFCNQVPTQAFFSYYLHVCEDLIVSFL